MREFDRTLMRANRINQLFSDCHSWPLSFFIVLSWSEGKYRVSCEVSMLYVIISIECLQTDRQNTFIKLGSLGVAQRHNKTRLTLNWTRGLLIKLRTKYIHERSPHLTSLSSVACKSSHDRYSSLKIRSKPPLSVLRVTCTNNLPLSICWKLDPWNVFFFQVRFHKYFYNNGLISRALFGSFLSLIRVQTDNILIYAKLMRNIKLSTFLLTFLSGQSKSDKTDWQCLRHFE